MSSDEGSGDGQTQPGAPSFSQTSRSQGHDGPYPMGSWTPRPTTGPYARLDPRGMVLLDRYRIVEQIGAGGMGTVYRAEHLAIGKSVAVKMLNPELSERADLVKRFEREARAAPRIDHPNVVDITDFGVTVEGFMFYVMEHLEGEDLSRMVAREGPVPWPRVRNMVLQVCRAMAAAHDRGVIHRDMKPANLFRTTKGGRRDFIKILDFGIAKMVDEGDQGTTQTGTVLGSIEYISPEHARGETPDHRADIYAVGVVMYELLTGRVPFQGRNRLATLNEIMSEEPLPPTMAAPDAGIPGPVEALVLRVLSKERAQRPSSMGELARDVEALDPELMPAEDERSPRGLSGTAIIVLTALLMAGLGVGLWAILDGRFSVRVEGPSEAASPELAGTAMQGGPSSRSPRDPEVREVERGSTPTELGDAAARLHSSKSTGRAGKAKGPAQTKKARRRKKRNGKPTGSSGVGGVRITLPSAEFHTAIDGLLPEIRGCAKTHALAVGTKVGVDIQIAGEDGKPSAVEIGAPHGGTDAGRCVAAHLSSLRFKPFEEEVVSFSFKYEI